MQDKNQDIINELIALNAERLVQLKELRPMEKADIPKVELPLYQKPNRRWMLPLALGGGALAASLAFIFHLSFFSSKTSNSINTLTKQEVLYYFETESDYFTDDELADLLENNEVNIFDAMNVSEKELSNYFFNQYTIQEEDLL